MWRNKSGPLLDNFRNKLCINFKNGHCSYGDGCRFVHKQGLFSFYSQEWLLMDS